MTTSSFPAPSSSSSSSTSADEWPLLPEYARPLTTRLDHLIANTPAIDEIDANDRRAERDERRKQQDVEEGHDADNLQSSRGVKRKSSERETASEGRVELVMPTFRGGGDDDEEEYDKVDEEHLSRVKPDDLYDPDMDDRDEAALQQRRNLPSGRLSDAVLSCPGCLTSLCLDCQRHTDFPHQYRAMLVQHCTTHHDKRVTPLNHGGRPGSRKAAGRGGSRREEQGRTDEVYWAVTCSDCGTEVGAVDGDDVYHFYHVLDTGGV